MATNAERMSKAGDAFQLVEVERKSLRAAGAILGVSYETVRRRVDEYKTMLGAAFKLAPVEERRAVIEQVIRDVHRRALEQYDIATKAGNTLHAVAALNTIVATLTHLRAITGSDMPKEAKVEQTGELVIKWSDE